MKNVLFYSMAGAAIVMGLAVVVLNAGCAAAVGPVRWAVGDAYVSACPPTAGPECVEEVRGGTLSGVMGGIVGGLLDAGKRAAVAIP